MTWRLLNYSQELNAVCVRVCGANAKISVDFCYVSPS